jgi:hypothetical protein
VTAPDSFPSFSLTTQVLSPLFVEDNAYNDAGTLKLMTLALRPAPLRTIISVIAPFAFPLLILLEATITGRYVIELSGLSPASILKSNPGA